ncbi:MAG: ACP S-malonyltransferase [Planctomycetota bacterium]
MTAPQNIAVICPGQGAQAVGMGMAWAERSPAARAVFDEADAILGETLGSPMSSLCHHGPDETLARTDISQPALYVSGIACWRGLTHELGIASKEAPLAAAAGLSLGEYTALHIAGAVSFEDGLWLVTLRGRAMQDAAEASPGGMVALIGVDEAAAEEIVAEARGSDVLVCANFNAPGQVVVSGDAAACDRTETIAKGKKVRATRLAVAGAFHSPLMQPAADRLGEALATTDLSEPACPVWSNVTAKPHAPSAEAVRAGLADQLTNPVRWAECFAAMATHAPGASFHEVAPGKTLAGMARRIDRSIAVTSHDSPPTAEVS